LKEVLLLGWVRLDLDGWEIIIQRLKIWVYLSLESWLIIFWVFQWWDLIFVVLKEKQQLNCVQDGICLELFIRFLEIITDHQSKDKNHTFSLMKLIKTQLHTLTS